MTGPTAAQNERFAVDLLVLRIARAYIEQGWCKDARARTADGEAVAPDSPLATQWCIEGAVIAATRGITEQDPERWLRYLMLVIRREYGIGQVSIGHWQDEPGRVQGEVVRRLFDVAIRLIEAKA